MASPPPCEKFLLCLHKTLLLGLFLVYYFALIPGSSSELAFYFLNVQYGLPFGGRGACEGFVGLSFFTLGGIGPSLVISGTESSKWFALSHVANQG